MKILVAEDEKILASSIAMVLECKGYDVDLAYDGEECLEFVSLGVYDLLILDVMMPKLNGFEVAEKLRKEHNGIPILMLTARTSLDDRVTGLNSGADYYLTKPFENKELLACVNALLRRQGNEVDVMKFGNTSLCLSSAILRCGSEEVRLSAKEFDIMRSLFKSGEKNISKEALLVKAWGYETEAVENYVEVYVGFLRKKLSGIGSDVKIESIRKLGYHLEVKKN